MTPIGLARAKPIAQAQPCTLADARLVIVGAHLALPIHTYAGNQLRFVLKSRPLGPVHLERAHCSKSCDRSRWGVWCLRTQHNGHLIATLRCCVCGGETATRGPEKVAPTITPLWAETTHRIPCEHCGVTTGVECHHWAPRALFGDPDDWPTSWLCVPCHQLWHRVVTPTMGQRRVA